MTVVLPEQRVGRVVLALPVETGEGHKYGHSLAEIGRLPAHLRDGTVFAAPTFSDSPWLVNHATRADCQQEDHLVRVVVPTVLAMLGTQARPPVHLLGFSKGGFAALNLLTRHPDLFAVASVWDASLLSDRSPTRSSWTSPAAPHDSTSTTSGTTSAATRAASMEPAASALGGIGTLGADWTAGRQLLEDLGIPHTAYRNATAVHRWAPEWLAPALHHLLTLENELLPDARVREE
ncbi:hypothetical protein J7E93_07340 [Streptomyces sp. ISL-36]|uniref:alpha/beta hydrolase-fold protein n=1 Tax=Streptomyces sp. ISL-36 TaxID=2819182 RepID=UPI001BEB95F9|nr:alpha/beta hydrolase-fold protein [Streptomyces sp. ISL-36]MBT2439937.1 hypothetical protein [Streptomyces sp. ISL-36]